MSSAAPGLGGGVDEHLLAGGAAAQQVGVVGHLGVDGDLGDRQVGELRMSAARRAYLAGVGHRVTGFPQRQGAMLEVSERRAADRSATRPGLRPGPDTVVPLALGSPTTQLCRQVGGRHAERLLGAPRLGIASIRCAAKASDQPVGVTGVEVDVVDLDLAQPHARDVGVADRAAAGSALERTGPVVVGQLVDRLGQRGWCRP